MWTIRAARFLFLIELEKSKREQIMNKFLGKDPHQAARCSHGMFGRHASQCITCASSVRFSCVVSVLVDAVNLSLKFYFLAEGGRIGFSCK